MTRPALAVLVALTLPAAADTAQVLKSLEESGRALKTMKAGLYGMRQWPGEDDET